MPIKKTIYTAIAAPGSGKTQKLLDNIPKLTQEGKLLVLALPTITLIKEVAIRASNAGLLHQAIYHGCDTRVVDYLEQALWEKTDCFVICTQESLKKVNPKLLERWTVIIDELPKVVEYHDYALDPIELKRPLDYLNEKDGKLYIKEGEEHNVEQQLATNRSDANGMDCSTLGDSAAQVFRLLLMGVEVFIDEIQSNTKRHVRAVEEIKSWWKVFSSASESHILAANILNTEFYVLAKANKFEFADSIFTPDRLTYTCSIKIYPIMRKGEIFSKTKMVQPHNNETTINTILKLIMEHVKSTPLLSANKWAKLQHAPNVHYLPKDCRGLNQYTHSTEAIILFGGNPSPSDMAGIKYLEAKYGIKFEEAYITTRLLEPALQVSTRSAVRLPSNTDEITFYVPDYRVAEYFKSTYFPNAVIDWSLADSIPIRSDGRTLCQEKEAEVHKLLKLNKSAVAINKITGVSRAKIAKLKQTMEAA
ncbi:MAG: hypothetical protein RR517_17585 [Pseudomonas sp.]